VLNHPRRWYEVAHGGTPSWDDRNKIIAQFIPQNSSVLDLGCGAKTLRIYLKTGCMYHPCDLIKSSPEVIQCDFNGGIYPELTRHYDYVVCSGVLEYIWKPQDFLTRISAMGTQIVLTYNTKVFRQSRIDRLSNNWVNHFTRRQLESLFQGSGLVFQVLTVRNGNEFIYSLTRPQTRPLTEQHQLQI
jgi:hypothetical protein